MALFPVMIDLFNRTREVYAYYSKMSRTTGNSAMEQIDFFNQDFNPVTAVDAIAAEQRPAAVAELFRLIADARASAKDSSEVVTSAIITADEQIVDTAHVHDSLRETARKITNVSSSLYEEATNVADTIDSAFHHLTALRSRRSELLSLSRIVSILEKIESTIAQMEARNANELTALFITEPSADCDNLLNRFYTGILLLFQLHAHKMRRESSPESLIVKHAADLSRRAASLVLCNHPYYSDLLNVQSVNVVLCPPYTIQAAISTDTLFAMFACMNTSILVGAIRKRFTSELVVKVLKVEKSTETKMLENYFFLIYKAVSGLLKGVSHNWLHLLHTQNVPKRIIDSIVIDSTVSPFVEAIIKKHSTYLGLRCFSNNVSVMAHVHRLCSVLGLNEWPDVIDVLALPSSVDEYTAFLSNAIASLFSKYLLSKASPKAAGGSEYAIFSACLSKKDASLFDGTLVANTIVGSVTQALTLFVTIPFSAESFETDRSTMGLFVPGIASETVYCLAKNILDPIAALIMQCVSSFHAVFPSGFYTSIEKHEAVHATFKAFFGKLSLLFVNTFDSLLEKASEMVISIDESFIFPDFFALAPTKGLTADVARCYFSNVSRTIGCFAYYILRKLLECFEHQQCTDLTAPVSDLTSNDYHSWLRHLSTILAASPSAH